MKRRQFLRNALVTLASAPAVTAAIARATAPIPARGLMFVDFADIETKPLDLDMLIELAHELKRSRGDDEWIHWVTPGGVQAHATRDYLAAIEAIPPETIEKFLAGFDPYRTRP
jgi:hypothetical protein